MKRPSTPAQLGGGNATGEHHLGMFSRACARTRFLRVNVVSMIMGSFLDSDLLVGNLVVPAL